ncbi:MAG: SCO family protein [Methanobacteriota archaeon]|nr:MAG: SCO family protein [Euryarchaeota archaeon]
MSEFLLMDPTEKKVVLAGLIFGIFVFSALFGGLIIDKLTQPDVPLLENPYPAKDFQLRNYMNETVQFKAYDGKVRLVTFVYQLCPDGCSTVASKVIQAQNRYSDSGKVASFVIDFDYIHDTSASLKTFAETLTGSNETQENLQFLYGNETEIKKVAADWNFFFQPVNETLSSTLQPNHEGGHKALWIHQFIVYVVDEDGLVQRIFTGLDWDNQDLYDTIDLLLSD